ncbi:Uncharacterized protein FWK35_00008754 [Aphis craccivora]|uniref:Uncharacterized protein n=1 Tax=Aphis craccivora TaxID=307492 RepID=A0A6G0YKD1_APHCR|nr:Uncharacterized protein FWK35_00008754 [Aphis craccivora]
MLKLLVDEEIALLAIETKHLISEKDIECIPEKVSNAIIDDTIAIGEIKQYFTADGWTVVQQIIKMKKQNSTWLCPVCSEDASKNRSVVIDA